MRMKLVTALVLAAMTMTGPALADNPVDKVNAWVSKMHPEERTFADAYARATWVQANLMAGQWQRAAEDLDRVKKAVDDLSGRNNIKLSARNRLGALTPQIDELRGKIERRDPAALEQAGQLVAKFGETTVTLAKIGWMRPPGGGAGTGKKPAKPFPGTPTPIQPVK